MKQTIERSLAEIYRDDPERGDAVVFGRRGALRGAGLAAMGAALGAAIPFGRHLPTGMLPVVLAQSAPQMLDFPGKEKGLIVLGDRPLVAETPEHMLDDDTTPTSKFFVRNNGQIPDQAANPDAWTIKVEGEVNTPLELRLSQLKTRFQTKTNRMVLECGGNGRSFFHPPGRGNQWTNGGAGAARWTGVALKDVLNAAGLKSSAKFTGSFGGDLHLSGDPGKQSISRGNPIAKSLDENTMIVWAMNGQPLANIHGAPVRLIVPGWPGSLSTKWLNRIVVRETPHDGQGMGGTSYRVPVVPIVPGSNNDGKTFRDMESMPVRSIVTNPANGTRLAAGARDLPLRGAAWAGDAGVARVDMSIDFGQTWQQADLTAPTSRYDWTRWTGTAKLPSDGYFEVWTRATDRNGVMQPIVAANWNPQGYGANPINRIAILVG
jgi:DMSO/TMAO reductase YedYZ molybdopterin-dependent catalytic subunit